uniref:Glycosyl hydrolase family 25 n=1 Tax=Steinernema glaseri TaxID=37863 RepID=A0A1I7Z041_9BILA
MILTTLLFAFALIQQGTCTIGLDTIQAMSVDTFKCLLNKNFKFFIARVWISIGDYDRVGIQNIKNARAAGIPYVDGYIFPCHRSGCAPAKNQVEATINRLRSDNAKFGMIWMDIERQDWPSNKQTNRQFIRDMVNQADRMGVKVGIYSNPVNWEAIVGLNWSEMSEYPLWWANYNGSPSFNGFKAFGGWTKPAIHQYLGDKQGPCDVKLDYNWYP